MKKQITTSITQMIGVLGNNRLVHNPQNYKNPISLNSKENTLLPALLCIAFSILQIHESFKFI